MVFQITEVNDANLLKEWKRNIS